MTDIELPPSAGAVLAHVEDLACLKGQWIRNVHTDKVYRICSVGTAGIGYQFAEVYGEPGKGKVYVRTFQELKEQFNIMVHSTRVENAK